MQQTLYVLFLFFVGVLIQTTTGFGASIIVMSGLPMVYTLAESMVLKTSVNIITLISVVYAYRKDIDFRLLTVPVLASLVFNYIGVLLLGSVNNEAAVFWLGIMLVVLSVYFFLFSEKVRVPANTFTALFCGGLSGFLGGLVGFGGPPIVLYYSRAIKDKRAYMATLQSFFIINGVSRLFFFAAEVSIDMSVLKIMPFAVIVSLLTARIGYRIYNRMPSHMIRKVIYTLMGLVGVYYILR